mmetsp:Transcript_47142/g.82984  ORF Transcript_47142/g.82984 Transcript_47142/m.82984 type:complete len:93 (+) Transcript_47142:1-279(+)
MPFFILGFLLLLFGSPCGCSLLGGTLLTHITRAKKDEPPQSTCEHVIISIPIGGQTNAAAIGAALAKSGCALQTGGTIQENQDLANELKANR